MSMLDEVLGRADLKARIETLEEENERLRNRLEAESDRRAEAVRERQDAAERVNRLEDRIAQLQGELDRLEGRADGDDLSWRRRERVRGGRLDAVLQVLESVRTGPEGALTAVVGAANEGDEGDDAPDGLPETVVDAFGDRAPLAERAAPCLCLADDTGIVSAALTPPVVPSIESGWDDRFRLDRGWFLPEAAGRYALALVRADVFAIGVYDGDERVAFRGFESDVKSAHSKGGFSQARFERIRDDQIDAHLDRCGEAIADALAEGLPADEGVERPDRLFLAGQRGAVDAVASEHGFDPAARKTVDATGKPEAALEDAFRSFWTTTLRIA